MFPSSHSRFDKINRIPQVGLTTQKVIADFLDQETERLDRIKNKTQEFIDHLREFHAALITVAVTDRIDILFTL